jgi:hypothetical protein
MRARRTWWSSARPRCAASASRSSRRWRQSMPGSCHQTKIIIKWLLTTAFLHNLKTLTVECYWHCFWSGALKDLSFFWSESMSVSLIHVSRSCFSRNFAKEFMQASTRLYLRYRNIKNVPVQFCNRFVTLNYRISWLIREQPDMFILSISAH